MAEPASTLRSGEFVIAVDGQWDMEDLLALCEAFSESYGFFYALVVTDEEAAKRIHGAIQKRFWSGDLDARRFGKYLYGLIPKAESLRLKSFQYSSPGSMTVIGVLAALFMAAKVARAWTAAGSELLDLWKKVEKYFEYRQKLRKPKGTTQLDSDLAKDVDEARKLAFEAGTLLGFDEISVERIIDINGNPISALKYLVSLANEARKLANLQDHGLLKLPPPQTVSLSLGRAPTRSRRGSTSGVKVETVKRRTRSNQSDPNTGSG